MPIILANDGWTCHLCPSENLKFDHKFQLVTHWHENHTDKEIKQAKILLSNGDYIELPKILMVKKERVFYEIQWEQSLIEVIELKGLECIGKLVSMLEIFSSNEMKKRILDFFKR